MPGLRYFDEEIVLTAAEKEGLDPELLAAVERMRTGLSRLGEIDIVTGGGFDEIQRSVIRIAIQEKAAAGKVVILAHAASIAPTRMLFTVFPASPSVTGRLTGRAALAKGSGLPSP